MVNSRKRDILERYRQLLENNLILTDNLLRWFRDRKVLPEFVFDEIQNLSTLLDKNKKFLSSIIDNGDTAFLKLIEGLISNGQPFLGELLEREDKKTTETTNDMGERVVIDDDMLRKCPGIDKLRADTREKLKTYLQEQLLKAHLVDTWKTQNQFKSVELINLKRQHYEAQQKLVDTIEEEKRSVIHLKDTLHNEHELLQQKDNEMKELRSELARLQSDFEQKWSSQIRMIDANNRSVFKMNDKMSILNEWLRLIDNILQIHDTQIALENDTADQLQNKLKQYTTKFELLQNRGIGTDKLKEDLYESLFTSRYLPIEDRKNKSFHDFLIRLYGSNQVKELATICTKDVIQSKLDRDHVNELRIRDLKIDELNRLNRELQNEIDRLKVRSNSPSESNITRSTKPQWRPVQPTVAVKAREKTKVRQTLKPISVQFDNKTGPTFPN